jgi:hypothetical protein
MCTWGAVGWSGAASALTGSEVGSLPSSEQLFEHGGPARSLPYRLQPVALVASPEPGRASERDADDDLPF